MHKLDKEIRNSIEAMDNVPAAFKFDVVQTWQKMEGQLQPCQQKKTTVWFYWSAAAVLIVAVCCFLLLNNNTASKNESKRLLSKKVPSKEVIMDSKNKSHKQQQAFNKQLAKKRSEKAKKIMPDANNIMIVQPNIIQLENIVASMPNAIDSSKAIPIASVQKPVKKRLKIIHLNELDEKEPLLLVQVKQNKKSLLQNDDQQAAPATGIKSWWQFRSKKNSATNQ